MSQEDLFSTWSSRIWVGTRGRYGGLLPWVGAVALPSSAAREVRTEGADRVSLRGKQVSAPVLAVVASQYPCSLLCFLIPCEVEIINPIFQIGKLKLRELK